MKPRWATACMGAAGLALGLAACGGGSSPSATSSSASTPPASSTSAAPASTSAAPASSSSSATSSSSGGSAASGGLTPPGTKLTVGQPATVTWLPPSEDNGTKAVHGIKLQVTVMSIQKGTQADFANIQLNAKEKKETPYYVNLQLKALTGKKPPTSSDDPGFAFNAIDDRGQQQGSITFFGNFQRCNTVSVPKDFVSGKTYTTCFAYLIAGGGSIQQVAWPDGPTPADGVSPYFDKPVVWSNH
jgi:hypothetical protein